MKTHTNSIEQWVEHARLKAKQTRVYAGNKVKGCGNMCCDLHDSRNICRTACKLWAARPMILDTIPRRQSFASERCDANFDDEFWKATRRDVTAYAGSLLVMEGDTVAPHEAVRATCRRQRRVWTARLHCTSTGSRGASRFNAWQLKNTSRVPPPTGAPLRKNAPNGVGSAQASPRDTHPC